MADYRQLIPEAAIAPVYRAGSSLLSPDADHSRLESCQGTPVAAIQRQLANGGGINFFLNCRRGELHLCSLAGHHAPFRNLAPLEDKIQGLLSSDGQRDARLYLCRKSRSRGGDFVYRGGRVRSAVEAGGVRRDFWGDACRRVFNGDSHVRDA